MAKKILRFTWKAAKVNWDRFNSFHLSYGGERLIIVSQIMGGWYWYGLGRNTAATPLPTAGAAKTQAHEFAKTKLDELKARFNEKHD